MNNPQDLKKAREKALRRYEELKGSLAPIEDLTLLQRVAQEANDAWLEFKKLDNEFANCVILKKLGDLYGC